MKQMLLDPDSGNGVSVLERNFWPGNSTPFPESGSRKFLHVLENAHNRFLRMDDFREKKKNFRVNTPTPFSESGSRKRFHVSGMGKFANFFGFFDFRFRLRPRLRLRLRLRLRFRLRPRLMLKSRLRLKREPQVLGGPYSNSKIS
jgi:hypothetical protein